MNSGPDLSELTRGLYVAASRQDVDAVMALHAADAVWDLTDVGLGIVEGAAAIRSQIEDWFRSFDYYRFDVNEVIELGGGVVFADVDASARLAGIAGSVDQRRGWVVLWVHGEIVRVGVYLYLDEARTAAERLAASRV